MQIVSQPLRAEARLLHVDLKRLAQAVAGGALQNIEKWNNDSGGRAVKAATEKLIKLLIAAPGFGVTSKQQREMFHLLQEIQSNGFFSQHISLIPTHNRSGPETIGEWLDYAGNQLFVLGTKMSYEEEVYEEAERDRLRKLSDEQVRRQVQSLVTEQQLGPIQFDISDGYLRLVAADGQLDTADVENAADAKEALVAIGGILLQDMRSSNCDERFVKGIDQLQADLRSAENVILLGMSASVQQAIAEKKADELSDIISGRLGVYLAGIQMYVAQFGAWRRFSNNVMAAQLDSSQVEVAKRAGRALLNELRSSKDAVDPKIEAKLSDMVTAIETSSEPNPKLTFSILRTVTNFVAVVFKRSASVIGDILVEAKKGVAEGAKSGASKVTNIAVLTLFGLATVKLFGYLSPATAKTMDAEWLPKAIEMLREAVKTVAS